jgi:integrase
MDDGRVAVKPKIVTLAEKDRRTGFFEREDYERVIAHLPKDVADVATYLYWTGWRGASEALKLQWSNVDLAAGVIRIEESKSDEPRTLPYWNLPVLRELIERRRAITDALQKERGTSSRGCSGA